MASIRLVLLLLCCWSWGLAAPEVPFGRMPVRTFGLEQGLLSTFVSSMAQDSQGVLWAGTEAGLHRFDGHHWRPVALALPHPMVLSVLADREGALWVSTRGGLVHLRNGRMERVPGGERETLFLHGLDAEGRIWAHHKSEVLRSTPSGLMEPVQGLGLTEPVVQVAIASEGKRVVVISTTRMVERDPSSGAWRDMGRDGLPHGLQLSGGAWDGEGGFWLLAGSRLFQQVPREPWKEFRREGLRFTTSQFASVLPDREGWVWVSTSLGLHRFRGGAVQVMAPRSYGQPMGFVDREGSPWFFGNGLMQVLGGGQWTVATRQDGLPREAIWGLGRERNGDLYASTHGGLARLTREGWRVVEEGHFVDIVQAPDGALLVGGRPGGRFLRIHEGRLERIPIVGAEREMECFLAVDQGDQILALVQSNRMFLGRRVGATWHWAPQPLPPGVEPSGFITLVRADGNRIFLSAGNRLHAWTGTGWRTVDATLPQNPWLAAVDADGRLVVGCLDSRALTVHRSTPDGGYAREGEIRLLDNEPPMYLFSLNFDAEGRLWVGTSRGLYQLSTDAILRVDGPGEGIPHPDVAYQAVRMEGEGLWVCTAGGIGYLRSRGQVLPVLPPPVLLQARTGGRILDPGQLQLGRRERHFEATFVVPLYRHPNTLRLEARWPSLDGTWQPLPAGGLSMPSIPPGSQRVELRATLPGRPPGPSLQLWIQVKPGWKEGPWAKAVLFLVVAGAGAGVVRLRQRRLESQNRRLQAEVAARTRDLERASEAKSSFLAGMSHELRTPLNAVLLYGELLGEEATMRGDEVLGRDLAKIHAAGRHLLALVNGILDIAKIEAGRMGLSREQVLLRPLIQDVVLAVQPQAEARGTVLEVEIPETLELQADELKLRQVLINLAGNAAKFTEQGVVRLHAARVEDRVRISVSDTGIGMTPEALGRIFRPYEQADARTERLYGGTGLGLTLSMKLVQLMGGNLSVTSAPGEGSTFTLDLPQVGPPPTD